ncbi:lyase [Phragmitibacter flavus]|uniref:Lyase n=1 Tax=Phragmitibacter flavus TaxID=2576071 RepID=A0A5R8KDZ4_9BACT|nr:HEAT repeat domain-containing protein [Phragmitibacter flavus]TLD70516.1 lyase [Phragmitibacter flavus]
MKTRHDERYEGDPTPSREVAQRCREAIDDDDRDVLLALLHYRGGDEEFRLGRDYSRSDDAGNRAIGADILAQLGWSDHTFQDESVAILTELLGDSDPHVIHRAAVGLGHRSAESAISALVSLSMHSDPLVRYGVVFGLSGHQDPRAIEALIELTRDADRDVRSWAVFGLGSQIDTDSPDIRDALRQALRDADHEIRGEGLVGLARRGDSALLPELINEWRDDEVSILSIEAAEQTRDPRLYHRLKSFTEILTLDDDPYFARRLADAIEACKPKAEQDITPNA